MNEAQRLEYLSALEIDNYMPTLALVNAPEAQLCDLPNCQTIAPHELSAGDITAQASQTNPITGSLDSSDSNLTPHSAVNAFAPGNAAKQHSAIEHNAAQSALNALSNSQSAPSGINKTSATTQTSISEVLVPRFSLSFWRPHPDWLLVDSRNPDNLVPTDYLFQAIAFALGFKQANVRDQEIMRWPMSDDDPESQSADHARAMLQTYLEVQLDAQPIKYLVLMGEEACLYLTDGQDLTQGQWSNSGNHELLASHSLAEMLNDSSLKKPLWLALKQKLA